MFPLAFYILTGLIGAGLDIQVAPDQPAPLFFTDEPLVVGLAGSDALRCSASLYVVLPDGAAVTEPLPLPDPSRGPVAWFTADLPRLRGAYKVYVTAGCPPGAERVERTIVRIDRPSPGGVTPFGVAIHSWSQEIGYGVRCLPAQAVRYDVTTPDLLQKIEETRDMADCRIHVRVSAEAASAGADIVRLAGELGDRVRVWEFDGVAGPQDFATLAASVRRAAPNAQVAVVLTRPQQAPAYLSLDDASFPDALVLSADGVAPGDLAHFTHAVQRAGYERIPLIIDFSVAGDVEAPAQPNRGALLGALAGTGGTVFLPQSRLQANGGGFGPFYASAAWTGRALRQATWLGDVTVEGGHKAWLARSAPGSEPGGWLLGVRPGPDEAFSIDPGESASFEILDAFGNPVAHDPGHERRIVLPAGDFWFVRGSGGTIVEEQLVDRVRAAAETILADEALAGRLPPEAAGALGVLTDYTYPGPVRFEFFALLRSLPPLEDRWHRGTLETRVAVPLIHRMARMAADLAVLEEDLGEAFLEPLEKTLATCEEWLERYPRPQERTPLRERRVAFLHSEVRRLMAESQAWHEAGRTTEAKALAALAEWRARCLAPAATAKRIPEPEPAAGAEDESAADAGSDAEEDA